MTLTYDRYLKLRELLALQTYRSDPPEHDEMLFIIIHQTYELWFKQILHEFGKLRRELQAGKTWTSAKTMRRVLTILKTMVAQIDILETMTPLEFNSFRGFLERASGFGSVQFREIEILCGMRSPHILKAYEGDPQQHRRLLDRMEEPTLWESYCSWLQQKGYATDPPRRVHEQGQVHESSPEIRKVLTGLMRNDPEAAFLTELFVDFDEGLMEWRYRHVKMVERTIGSRTGTGGTQGAAYLHETLNRPVFPDLWAIRSEF